MPDPIPPREIIGVAEILKLTGIRARATLLNWRNRGTDPFPQPIRKLKSGELWDRREVRAWFKRQELRDDAGVKRR